MEYWKISSKELTAVAKQIGNRHVMPRIDRISKNIIVPSIFRDSVEKYGKNFQLVPSKVLLSRPPAGKHYKVVKENRTKINGCHLSALRMIWQNSLGELFLKKACVSGNTNNFNYAAINHSLMPKYQRKMVSNSILGTKSSKFEAMR